MPGEGLDPAVEARLVDVLDGVDGLVVAYLHGSRATGTAAATSDVDVAVLCRQPLAPEALAELTADLQSAVGATPVDVVDLHGTPVALAYRVLRDGRVLTTGDEDARIAHWVDVVDRWIDMAPLRATLAEAQRDRLAEGRFGRP